MGPIPSFEELIRRALEQLGEGVVVVDTLGTIRAINRAAELQWAVAHQALLGAELLPRALDLQSPEGAPLTMPDWPLFAALQGERVRNGRYALVLGDGERRVFSATATPVYDARGALLGAVMVSRDESERLWMEERLVEENLINQALVHFALNHFSAALSTHEELQALARALVDNIRIICGAQRALLIYQPAGRGPLLAHAGGGFDTEPSCPADWNRSFNANVLIGRDDLSPDDPLLELIERNGVKARSLLGARLEPAPGAMVGALVLIDDRKDWFNVTAERLFGSLASAVGPALEAARTAERAREADRLLRESEEHYRQLTNALPQHVWTSDPSGRGTYFNQTALDYFQKSAAELSNPRTWLRLIHPDEVTRVVHERQRAIAEGRPYSQELRLKRHDGAWRWHMARALPMRDEAGNIVSWFGTLTDIDEQRRIEEEQIRLAELVEHSHDAIIATDLQGRVISWNLGAERMFGWRAEEVKGKDEALLFPVDRRAEEAAQRARAARFESVESWETVRLKKSGEPVVVSMMISPLLDVTGQVIGTSSIARDITEQKKMQNRLVLSDRMVSIGTLASGVAHEINNPLAYVISNMTSVQRDLSAIAQALQPGAAPEVVAEAHEALREMREALTEAQEGAERVRSIVLDLKTFSRADETEVGPIHVRPAIESALNMAGNEIRHRARLVKSFTPVPKVLATHSRLSQVFLNLLVNAAQAIREGHVEENEIRVHVGTDAAGRVLVEVSDTGSGIPADVQRRIFDPFFTTKPVGVGTGLGLSICHGIVASMGGEITVDSAPGQGTTFRVHLPAAAESAAAPPPAEVVEVATERRGRLLVVDDEPLTCTALRRTLGDAHELICVQSGAAALKLFESGEGFDLVLSDLMMPEMNGPELYRRTQALAPEQAKRFVFLTGGAFTHEAQTFLEAISLPVVHKPFDALALRAMIARRLTELAR